VTDDDEDDFGGADMRAPATALATNVIPFPNVRPSEKLAEAWAKELQRANAAASKSYRFASPLAALDELMRKRELPTLPWPAQWEEFAKRARLYAGECVGIVGPTGGGKTSFAIQMARAAMAAGIPVLWSAKELDPPELNLRLIANMAGIHTARIREEWTRDRLARELAIVDDLWRFVDNLREPDAQLEAYRVAIKLAKRVYGRSPLLVIDYIGKFARGSKDPRLMIADVADSVRDLILTEDAYGAILSQPSRANNATLTGKNELDSATDAIQVAGESSEIEHACSVMLGLNVFKQDDAEALDAHVLVSKARGTGREGREGFRFHKAGGVWQALDQLPPTPIEIDAKLKEAKRDKSRANTPTKEIIREELAVIGRDDADADRRRKVIYALREVGAYGMTVKDFYKKSGVGRGPILQQTLQELERSGDVERLIGSGRWRIITR
jgi:KaiC/GvpD/RAD55 family RecA-like ATPase